MKERLTRWAPPRDAAQRPATNSEPRQNARVLQSNIRQSNESNMARHHTSPTTPTLGRKQSNKAAQGQTTHLERVHERRQHVHAVHLQLLVCNTGIRQRALIGTSKTKNDSKAWRTARATTRGTESHALMTSQAPTAHDARESQEAEPESSAEAPLPALNASTACVVRNIQTEKDLPGLYALGTMQTSIWTKEQQSRCHESKGTNKHRRPLTFFLAASASSLTPAKRARSRFRATSC